MLRGTRQRQQIVDQALLMASNDAGDDVVEVEMGATPVSLTASTS